VRGRSVVFTLGLALLALKGVSAAGQGWSSPVVWGDHIFVTSAIRSGGEEPVPVRDPADPL